MTVMDLPADHQLEPAFARHETFHPRYGWLKKGFDAAGEDDEVFLRDDATTVLGVGKNMVRAIRYWCVAYKVLAEETSERNPRLNRVVATDFGTKLLAEDGWDPYLEDPASLWLLHWHLLRPPCRAPAWWATFNEGSAPEFDDKTLLEELRRFRDEHAWNDVVDNSLDKDVRCILRMYGSVTRGRDLLEDSVDSPFAELGLLREVPGGSREWSLDVGPKQSLPDDVVTYACLDYAQIIQTESRIMGVAGLARNEGGPGRAFGLNETALGDALKRFAEETQVVGLTHAAGNRQLVLPHAPEQIGEAILRAYYGRQMERMPAR
jgi:hypothetical protein